MNKQQAFLLLVIGVAGVASLLIILPILQFVLMAIILAYVLHPLNRRLEPKLGRHLSPMVIIMVTTVALLLPLVYIGYVLFKDLQDIARAGPDLDIRAIERWVADITGERVNLRARFEDFGTGVLDVLFGDLAGVVSGALFVVIGLVLMVFVIYYLLRDGQDAVKWIITVTPMTQTVGNRLMTQIDKTTYGVIVGHLLVAIIEGILGGIAFWLVGIPNVIFWAFVMTLLSLLPIIGPFLVWGPAVGYLALINEPLGAAFMLLWGLIVIGLVDNWVRPILVDREAQLNPAVVLIGVFGGIYAIGPTGLFVGPIIVGVFIASIRVFHDEWDRMETRENSATTAKK